MARIFVCAIFAQTEMRRIRSNAALCYSGELDAKTLNSRAKASHYIICLYGETGDALGRE